MKEFYKKPESKVDEFTTTDVISTSSDPPSNPPTGGIDPIEGADD